MEYPAEFQGASKERIAELGVGKLVTFTSTYDHRIIQGAESGDFLRTVHELLLSDDFFDEIFRELGIPYEPVRWRTDNPDSIEDKNGRVIELIAAYRNRGHLMADIDPLRLDQSRFRSHPDLDVNSARPDAVGPGPRVQGRRLRRLRVQEAARRARAVARRLLPSRRRRVHPHPGTRTAEVAAGTRGGQRRQTGCGAAEVHPAQAERRGGVRDLPGDQIRWAEAVFAGRRRGRRPDDGRRDRPGRRARTRRGRHRHAAPRPAQRAGQHRRQAVLADLFRVRGQPEPGAGPRVRRRQVSPRCHRYPSADVRRQRHCGVAGGQPVTFGGRRSGAGGSGAGQAGPAG